VVGNLWLSLFLVLVMLQDLKTKYFIAHSNLKEDIFKILTSKSQFFNFLILSGFSLANKNYSKEQSDQNDFCIETQHFCYLGKINKGSFF